MHVAGLSLGDDFNWYQCLQLCDPNSSVITRPMSDVNVRPGVPLMGEAELSRYAYSEFTYLLSAVCLVY